MKSTQVIAIAGFLIFAGAIIVWKVQGQAGFSDEIRNFVAAGVTRIEICEVNGSNVVHCKSARHESTVKTITSALAANVPKTGPGHAIASFERVMKLYRRNEMLCFRVVEFQQENGILYLDAVEPNQDCSTFKYAPHSVLVKGLDRSLLIDGN